MSLVVEKTASPHTSNGSKLLNVSPRRREREIIYRSNFVRGDHQLSPFTILLIATFHRWVTVKVTAITIKDLAVFGDFRKKYSQSRLMTRFESFHKCMFYERSSIIPELMANLTDRFVPCLSNEYA